tara:strand:+ start:254 stop:586 length:333 start_codon:yes stop_codon:yes gene_type:complete
MGESTTVELFEAKLRIRVFNQATLRADAVTVPGTVLTTSKVSLSGLTDWQEGCTIDGPGSDMALRNGQNTVRRVELHLHRVADSRARWLGSHFSSQGLFLPCRVRLAFAY